MQNISKYANICKIHVKYIQTQYLKNISIYLKHI